MNITETYTYIYSGKSDVVPIMTAQRTAVVLLLLFTSKTHAEYQNINIDSAQCSASGGVGGAFSYYESAQFITNSTNGNMYFVGQPTNSISYTYEGSRKTCPMCDCTFCPHDADTAPDDYWSVFDNPTSAYLQLSQPYKQMYGPCLDGKASTPMPCIQNADLHPPDILGVYYYPVQKNVIDVRMDESTSPALTSLRDRFKHSFLISQTPYGASQVVNGVAVSPTSWGLGKQVMLDRINSFQIKNRDNGLVNTAATNEFLQPYIGSKWAAWAQMFCTAGCHRDTMYTLRYFNSTADYGNDPKYATLERFIAAESGAAHQDVPNCAAKCPPGQAVYTAATDGKVYHPRLATFWYICRPWFGALPQLKATDGNQFEIPFASNVQFDAALKISAPLTRPVYTVASFCPVNFYNRECAETKLRWVNTWLSADTLKCDKCPDGYHTNGSTGSWFCLPPSGLVFSQRTRDVLLADMPYKSGSITNSTQWRHRNFSFFEFECGASTECYQCSDAICTGCAPSEFNEQVIFGPFFAVSLCPQNSYCPDGVTVVQCPSSKPYSPAGSWGASNCTCKRGTYLGGDGTCKNCTSSCSPGTYLPTSLCMAADGATADAPCRQCDNYDSSTTDLDDTAAGVQGPPRIVGVQTNATAIQGYCNTRCKSGYQIDKTTLQCKPMTRIMIGGRVYYSQSLSSVRDRYLVSQGVDSSLTTALLNLQTQGSSGLLSADTICIINITTGVPTYPGLYVGYEPTPCVPCAAFSQAPYGAHFIPVYPPLDSSVCSASNVVCNEPSAYYFNGTAWACQSCIVRQGLVGCPANTSLVGQGCANISRPFNLTSPTSDCQRCSLAPSSVYNGKYLYTPPDGSSTCYFKDCTLQPNWYFPANGLCVGTNPGSPTACNSDNAPCPTNYYITPTNKLLGCTSLGWLCQACNYAGVPGTYYDSAGNCTTNGQRDIQTQPCPLNYYCPGRGPPIACPDIQITGTTGTASIDQCFCPLGYTTQVVNSMTKCVYTPCANTTSLPNTPGTAVTSPYYMTMDLITLKTVCSLCTLPGPFSEKPAMAIGNTFGFDSCACPAGYYGSAVTVGSSLSLSCLACDDRSVPTCGSGAALPTSTCQTAGLYVTSNNNAPPFSSLACTPAYPPFSTVSAATYTCGDSLHFIRNPDTSVSTTANLGVKSASGSSLYVTQSAWSPVYTQQADSSCYLMPDAAQKNNMAVAQAVVSSSSVIDSGNVAAEPPPFVFWIPTALAQGTQLMVYGTCASCPTVMCADTTVPTASTPTWHWQVYPSTSYSATYSSQALAIGTWASHPTLQSHMNTAVAVVVLKTQNQATSLELCITVPSLQLETDRSQSTLGPANATRVLSLPLTPGTHSVVDMVDSNFYAPVQTQPPYGVFFVAYNSAAQGGFPASCGVLVAGIQDASTETVKLYGGINNAKRDLCSLPISGVYTTVARTALLSVTALRYATGTSLYLLYADAPNKVYVTQVVAPALGGAEYPEFSTLIEYAYYNNAPSSLIGGMHGLFRNMANPLLITMANGAPCSSHAGDSSSHCIVVADSYQRTFVGIQDLPWGSNPAIIAGASVKTSSTALLFVASGSNIFSITINLCSTGAQYVNPSTSTATTIPQYWNGRQCVPQLCIRVPPCGEHQHFDGARCVCDAGYYYSQNSGCVACSLSNYCPGNSDQAQYTCQPSALRTTVTAAYSSKQCLCPISGYYFNAQSQSCAMCAAGQYCPDQWNVFSCPSPMDVKRISSSSSITSSGCVCQAGTYGATCQPCPQGMICPASTGNTMVAQGKLFHVKLGPASAGKCDVQRLRGSLTSTISSLLQVYFASAPQMGLTADNFAAYVYMNLYNTTNAADLTQPCTLMVTTHVATSSSNWVDFLIQSAEASYLAGTANLVSGLTAWGTTDINAYAIVNVPMICPAMQVPDAASSYTRCICAAGAYATSISSSNTVTCTACPKDTYTSSPNTVLTCLKCDTASGFHTDASGSSNCTKSSGAPGGSSTSTSDSSVNVAVIAGASAVGLLVLIGIIAFACTRTATTTTKNDKILRLPLLSKRV